MRLIGCGEAFHFAVLPARSLALLRFDREMRFTPSSSAATMILAVTTLQGTVLDSQVGSPAELAEMARSFAFESCAVDSWRRQPPPLLCLIPKTCADSCFSTRQG